MYTCLHSIIYIKRWFVKWFSLSHPIPMHKIMQRKERAIVLKRVPLKKVRKQESKKVWWSIAANTQTLNCTTEMRCLNVTRAKYTSERINVYGHDAAFFHTSVFVTHRTIAWSKQHKWSYAHCLFLTCLCLWSCNKLIYIEIHRCSFSATTISLSTHFDSVLIMCFEYKYFSRNYF